MFALRSRDGFALPMTILVIGFMTAGVIAAFARTSSEVQLVDNERGQLGAFTVAEAGLQQFLSTTGGTPPATSVFKYGTRDSAIVTATLMRPAVGGEPAIWLIRSEGILGTPAVGRPLARRTVAQFAFRVVGTMHVVSSWTSLSGLTKNGAAGDITGSDACSGSVLAGVATPTGMLTGKDDAITGNPDHLEMGTQSQMADAIKIDWIGISDASAPSISPNYTYCLPSTYGYDNNWSPCNGWPSTSLFTNPNFWPTIVINGTSPLPSNGRGTLIVTGDLTFGGGDTWEGIIMVGGAITDNGSGNIAGAVVSGLNVKKGWTVGESSKANGTKDYTYDSCAVASAAANQSRFVQLTNAWVDNWTNW